MVSNAREDLPEPDKPVKKCPKCGEIMVEKKNGLIQCSACEYKEDKK